MKSIRTIIATISFTLIATTSFATPIEDVEAATLAWADAYNTRVVNNVLARYAPDAVFWGTVSPTLRDEPAEVRDYFKGMPERPHARVTIGDHRARVFGDIAVNTGFYTFTDIRDGQATRFPARFSFVYKRSLDGEWIIIDHHSSAIPESR